MAVEYFDVNGSSDLSRNYAFKCHRKGDVAYPVNALAFHPLLGTFLFLLSLLLPFITPLVRDIRHRRW